MENYTFLSNLGKKVELMKLNSCKSIEMALEVGLLKVHDFIPPYSLACPKVNCSS